MKISALRFSYFFGFLILHTVFFSSLGLADTPAGGAPGAGNAQTTGPQGQTANSTYYTTDPSGQQVPVNSELGKAALVMGGYVPVPNPQKAGTFLFVNPDAAAVGGAGTTGGTGTGGTGSGGGKPSGGETTPPSGTGGAGTGGTTPPAGTGTTQTGGAQGATPQGGQQQPQGQGSGNTVTNNGTEPVTVQVKQADGNYGVQQLGPGQSMTYPDGSHYIRVFPTQPNQGNPNIKITGPGNSSSDVNQFNQKTSPPQGNNQTSMNPDTFGDQFASAGVPGSSLGSDIHSPDSPEKDTGEHYDYRHDSQYSN